MTDVQMAEKLLYREEGFFGSFDYSDFLWTLLLMELYTKQRWDKTYPRSFFKQAGSENHGRGKAFSRQLSNQTMDTCDNSTFRVQDFDWLLTLEENKAWHDVHTRPVN